jgi:glycosyltransferase involved in cell wall biosynthesis
VNVLLTSRLYPSSAYPERGTFVHNQAHFLAELCQLEIIVPTPFFPSLPGFGRWSAVARVGKREMLDGLAVSFPRYLSLPRRVLFTRAWRFYLRALKRGHMRHPDLIHAHLAYPDGRAAVEYGRQLGVPVIISVHGHDVREIPLANERWRTLVAEALQQADAVIASSRDVRERVLALGVKNERLHDIPQGVDCRRFVPATERTPGAGGWRLLYAGRFDPKKGLGVLLEAMHLLCQKRQDITLKLVGGSRMGGSDTVFQKQAAELGLVDRVEFVEAVPWAEIPEIMAAADLFVLPSFYDSFGIVLIEAMACGMPVVSTRCGGPEDIVDAAVGLLAEVGDASSLANAIDDALNRYGRFDREAIRRRAEQQYDYRQVAARVHAVYEGVLKSA